MNMSLDLKHNWSEINNAIGNGIRTRITNNMHNAMFFEFIDIAETKKETGEWQVKANVQLFLKVEWNNFVLVCLDIHAVRFPSPT